MAYTYGDNDGEDEVLAEASVTLPSHKEKPVSQAPSKKVLRSAGEQKYIDSTQLALFD